MGRLKFLFLAFGIIVAILLVTIPLATSSKRSPSPTSPQPEPFRASQTDAKAQTILSVLFAKSEVAVGETFAAEVNIDTGGNLVTGVELEMAYDPKIVAVDSIVSGNFFKNSSELLNKSDTKKGQILFAVISFDGKKGTGTVAKLRLRALAKTKGKVEILTIAPTTLVSQLDSPNSVLKELKGASLVIR